MSDARVRDDIRAMSAKERELPQLDPAPNAPPQNSRRGVATTPQSAGGGGGGSGLPAELEEVPGEREWHRQAIIVPDGCFFAYSVSAIKKMVLRDDEGGTVTLSLAENEYPPADAEGSDEP